MPLEKTKSDAVWRQVWYLEQRGAKGEFLYRKGLSLAERNELRGVLLDVLDQERGAPLSVGTADDRETVKPAEAVPTVSGELLNPSGYTRKGQAPQLWIPWAQKLPSGLKQGQYAQGHPTGLVVHWTAGHRNGLASGNEWMRTSKMLYLLVDGAGQLGQSDPLNFHGWHAYPSAHKEATGSVADEFHGVELQAAGMLEKVRGGKFRSDFGSTIDPSEVLEVPAKRGNMEPGFYHAYSRAQVDTLRRLVLWLAANSPHFSINRVVGHDEVSPGRKSDPGGALWLPENGFVPVTMAEFREQCWADFRKLQGAL